MAIRQKILGVLYPLFRKWKQQQAVVLNNAAAIKPPHSFYDLKTKMNNGSLYFMESLAGKKVLIVNTASACGYTAQYAELEELYKSHSGNLEILCFPANDFKEQEKLSDEEIAQFCRVNYGLSFPLAKKAIVIKNDQQHEVFQWLTNKERNGWNDQQPSWNFCKYLVDENGVLTHFFSSAISPLSREVVSAVEGN